MRNCAVSISVHIGSALSSGKDCLLGSSTAHILDPVGTAGAAEDAEVGVGLLSYQMNIRHM